MSFDFEERTKNTKLIQLKWLNKQSDLLHLFVIGEPLEVSYIVNLHTFVIDREAGCLFLFGLLNLQVKAPEWTNMLSPDASL